MARSEIEVSASAEEVFDVLLDPTTYPNWLVGARNIRGIDDAWPAPGSHFHHTVGIGPFTLHDKTKILSADPPQRLVLEAKARPAGVAEVVFEIEPVPTGSRVVLHERPVRGPAALAHNRVLEGMISTRNRQSLRQLADFLGAAAAKPQ